MLNFTKIRTSNFDVFEKFVKTRLEEMKKERFDLFCIDENDEDIELKVKYLIFKTNVEFEENILDELDYCDEYDDLVNYVMSDLLEDKSELSINLRNINKLGYSIIETIPMCTITRPIDFNKMSDNGLSLSDIEYGNYTVDVNNQSVLNVKNEPIYTLLKNKKPINQNLVNTTLDVLVNYLKHATC